MLRSLSFPLRQAALIGMAAFAYFRVRALTEGDEANADFNAGQVLEFERRLGIDLELGLQSAVAGRDWLVNLANWVYIWGHWPAVITTLVALAIARRNDFYELRNSMFISGGIGLLIFARYAVTPPRLLTPEYIDTVTLRSVSYRVLQPPSLVNQYAAVPSLHLGWNLLVGLAWRKVSKSKVSTVASLVMPVAMGLAVVATANHWTFDIIAGAAVALGGLGLERLRQRHWPAVRANLKLHSVTDVCATAVPMVERDNAEAAGRRLERESSSPAG